MFDAHRLRVLAPSALVFISLFLLVLHLSGSARKMENKQKERNEVFQAAKRRELIQKESGGDEHRTLSKKELDFLRGELLSSFAHLCAFGIRIMNHPERLKM